MVSLKQMWEVLYRLKNSVGQPATGTLSEAVEALPTTDHLTVFSRHECHALDAVGGTNTDLTPIPAGSNWYKVVTSDDTRALQLDGYSAASNSPRTATGGIVPFTDSGLIPIPLKLDDGGTTPTHIYLINEGAVDGWVWVYFFE